MNLKAGKQTGWSIQGTYQTTKGSGYLTREPVLSSHHNKALIAVRSIEGVYAGGNSPGDDKLIKR